MLAVALALLAQIAQADPRALRSPVDLDSANAATLGGIVNFVLPQAAPPDPSGAEPPYPLNHTLDGQLEGLGSLQNANFETAPGSVGSPPANSDIETAPIEATAPTNDDFETGDFTGWTVTGSPSIQSDATHGYWARFGSNAQVLVSTAVTVPLDPHALVYEVHYQSTTVYSWVDVYVLSGTDYATSTLVKGDKCFACGYWSTSYIDLTAYAGQSIKFKFRSTSSPVGIDDVRVEDVFPGYAASGDYARRSEGSDHFASLNDDAWIVTDPFTLDDSAQFGTVELKGKASNSTYNIAIATGPSYGTWTTLATGTPGTSWQTVSFNIAAYAGQAVKIRTKSTNNVMYFDEILASQTADIPYWTPSGTTSRIEDAGNHFISSSGSLTSNVAQIPATVQNTSFRLRSSDTASAVFIELLRGAGFTEVVQLAYVSVPSTWTTVKVGLVDYAGETVKFRIRKQLANPAFHLDDAGFFESVLAGWTPATLDPLGIGSDAQGTFATSYEAGGLLFIESSLVSPDILDKPNRTDSRFYSVSYDLTASGNSSLFVYWEDETGHSTTVGGDSSTGPTGYRTIYFPIYDFLETPGHLVVKITNGGRLYSIGDNVARQQLTEPFSRKVGLGIDTTTGSLTFADQDVSIPGPIPLSFTRYYNAHSDLLGLMGFRWSHTYDTHLVFADDDVGVVFGSGREEFFAESGGSYSPVDVRIQSTLVENGGGTFTLTTKDNLTYLFSAQGALTEIGDLNGNTLVLAYDGQGRLASVTGAGGVTLTFAYTAGLLSSVTDPAGSSYALAYDPGDDLATVTDPEEGVRTYAYDRHRLTTVTDEEGGLVVGNGYDEVNRVISQTDSEDETILVAIDTPGKGATEVTYPDGGVATFYFDTHHRTSHTIDPSGRMTSFLYDGNGNIDKVVDSGENEWDLAFDAAADLTFLEDPLGNPVSFDYNAIHLPTSVTDARGNLTTYAYDTDGNMTSQTDPLDNTTTYTYDANGNMLTVADPLGRTTTYTYNSKGLKTSEEDPLGSTTTYTYTSLGKLATETDPLGNTTTYSYDLLGRIVGIEDPLGRDTTFLYDFVGHLLLVQDPLGNETMWDYDERGLVESKTDPAGLMTTYTYDENRRMTSMTNPADETTTYGYDDAGRLTLITDPLGNETAYTYDAEGHLSSEVDPLDRQTLYGYDAAGHLVEITQPNDAIVMYGYDLDGNLTSTTDELDRVSTNAYDEVSRIVSTTDPLGNETTYGYDDAGQMISITDPLGNEETYGYDNAGRQVTVVDETDRTTTTTYDDAGQMVAVTDPGNNTTENEYDLGGHLTSLTSPLGNVTAYAYNSRGLLTSVTDPLLHTTSFNYDDAGRLLAETDPTGALTTYGYDNAGRMTSITDDLGGIVGFGYDAASQLTSITDPNGETWTYGYNPLGLRTSITDPLDRVISFGYNAAGELTSETDGRGITTSYVYDDAGQMTAITFPGGSTGYTYDDGGRRTSMVDATGSTSYTYDDAGRTTSVASPNGAIAYGFDEAGRRTYMTLPGARTVTYAYNVPGLLGTVTDWRDETVTIGYDADGNRTSISRANGVDSTYSYDDAGRITDINHADGAEELLSFGYGYDAADRPIAVTSDDGTETYDYDDLGRLTSVWYPGGQNVSYTYDEAGNRLTETEGASTTDYTYDGAGQLISVGSATYEYDDAGNVIEAGPDAFTWDHSSRLLTASIGLHSATYTYSGDGTRVESDVDSVITPFLVDGEATLPTVVDDGNRAYIHVGGVVESVQGADALYSLDDRLATVRGLTDEAGALVGTASYEAFGAPRDLSGTQGLFGFAGEASDATGLTYLRARYLDSQAGRMLSADSVVPNAPLTQGYNLYAYAANNPTTWTDPTGHLVLDQQTVDYMFWEIVRQLEQHPEGLGAIGGAAAVLRGLLPGAGLVLGIAVAIIGVIFIAAFLFAALQSIRLHAANVDENGSPSLGGKTSWTPRELLDAANEYPEPPGVVAPAPGPQLYEDDPFPDRQEKYHDHGHEFGGYFSSLDEYVYEAIAIAGGSVTGGKGPFRGESCKARGKIYIWDNVTRGIVIVNELGEFIENYFRPTGDGYSYWLRQCERQ